MLNYRRVYWSTPTKEQDPHSQHVLVMARTHPELICLYNSTHVHPRVCRIHILGYVKHCKSTLLYTTLDAMDTEAYLQARLGGLQAGCGLTVCLARH